MTFKITAEEKRFVIKRRILGRRLKAIPHKQLKTLFWKRIETLISKHGKADYKKEQQQYEDLDFDTWKEFLLDDINTYLKWKASDTRIEFTISNTVSGWNGLGTGLWKLIKKDIPQWLERRGWYLKDVKSIGGFQTYYCETVIGERLQVPHFLYHIGPTHKKKKILNRGLYSQKQSREGYSHKGRVYLVSKEGIDELFMGLQQHDWGTERDGTEYSVFKIDTAKLPKGIKFYRDPDLKDHGYYTYTHIPPQAIKFKEDLEYIEEQLY